MTDPLLIPVLMIGIGVGIAISIAALAVRREWVD